MKPGQKIAAELRRVIASGEAETNRKNKSILAMLAAALASELEKKMTNEKPRKHPKRR